MSQPTRREFLKSSLLAGCFFVTAGVPRAATGQTGATGLYHFPQGVASGDPRPDGIVLWTRVESIDPCSDPVDVTLEVARDSEFNETVVERSMTATELTDHTLRVVVDGLESDTRYFYRFRVGGDYSQPLGRTRTAPAFDADRELRFAFASCQNYEQGYFGAWSTMIAEDEQAPEDEQLDFVLHLGDFIYERAHFNPGDEANAYPEGPLKELDGTPRTITAFPDGTADARGRRYAVTVDDYRHLYKTYLSDPQLRAARARWPFVCTWDDHEFTNNAWQSQSTYTAEGAPAARRKVAANQAWFEYIPAMLSGLQSPDDIDEPSRDFVHVEVDDTQNEMAIRSMTIYRRLRYGQHLDLVITDCRQYRSDHAVPDDLSAKIGGRGTALLPVDIVRLLDAGTSANSGNPPSEIEFRGRTFPNPRAQDPPATVLGPEQKAWWKRVFTESEATWKIWANSIPAMPLRLDLYDIDPPRDNSVLSSDAWDGFPGERTELLTYLRDNKVANVISLSGDHHMHFAGQLVDDYDADEPYPVGAEFSVSAISSTPTFMGLSRQFLPPAFQKLAYLTQSDGQKIPLFNLSLLQGVAASYMASEANDPTAGVARRNPKQNPHLRFIDSASNGYGLIRVKRNESNVTMVSTQYAADTSPDAPAPVMCATHFVVYGQDGEKPPSMGGPTFEGIPPYPFS